MHFAVHDSGTAILDGIESNDDDLALLPGGSDGFDGTQSHHVIAGEHGLHAGVSLQYVLKDIEPLVSFPICSLRGDNSDAFEFLNGLMESVKPGVPRFVTGYPLKDCHASFAPELTGDEFTGDSSSVFVV
jgi:hypothetical protein